MAKRKKWVNAKEYADTHDLPVSTIRQYCRSKEIPSFKIGPRYMFDPEVMDAFIEWKAQEGLRYIPGTFLGDLKRAKEGTRISVWKARQEAKA